MHKDFIAYRVRINSVELKVRDWHQSAVYLSIVIFVIISPLSSDRFLRHFAYNFRKDRILMLDNRLLSFRVEKLKTFITKHCSSLLNLICYSLSAHFLCGWNRTQIQILQKFPVNYAVRLYLPYYIPSPGGRYVPP